MIYLSQFVFPSIDTEERFLHQIRETCFSSVYPFQILPPHEVRVLNFDESLTILYGGNGSGKTTVLNVIAEKLCLGRDTLYNRSNFIEDSIRFFGCQFIIATHSPFLLSMKHSKIYNLDEEPMKTCSWTELPNVRAYYDFFKKHQEEFL